MRFGIHLPQYGGASSGEAIRRAAIQAEALGFEDVWVSDHVVVPENSSYPPPYLFDPFTTLTWAASVTERIRLGTSVLVLPQHSTVAIANTCASLDALAGGGRVVLGVGAGWLEGEFRALGADFSQRGARLDEAIDVLRACWREDPTNHRGEFHDVDSVRLLPKPGGEIPIWVGGHAERSFRRGAEKGDGFHALGKTPEEMAVIVARLRRDRPDEAFTISLRRGWDGLKVDPVQLRDEIAAYRDAGVQHLMAAPTQRTTEDWLKSVELLAVVFSEFASTGTD